METILNLVPHILYKAYNVAVFGMSFGLAFDKKGWQILAILVFIVPVSLFASFFLPEFFVTITISYILLYVTVLFILLYLENPNEGDPAQFPSNVPSIAVLIACFNSKNTIEKCIESIKKMNYPQKFRIIVADDGSTDGSTQILEKMNGIELLKFAHRGKGYALNGGLQKINEDLIVCIDSDTYPEENALMKMVGHFEEAKIGAVNGRIVPDKKENFIQRLQYFEYIVGFGLWNTVLSSINGMTYVTGPFTIFRRNALVEAGYYFDTKNLAEDMEIGLRLQKFNYKIKVCSSVAIETDIPNTIKKLAKQRDRWYRSRVFNIIKYRELAFNRKNSSLGFFAIPYLFMVEMLMVVVFLRVSILVLNNIMNFFQVNLLLIFQSKIQPPWTMDLVMATHQYFFIFALAAVAVFYLIGLKKANYKFDKADLPAIIAHILLYPFFTAAVYLRGLWREFKVAKPTWERVST